MGMFALIQAGCRFWFGAAAIWQPDIARRVEILGMQTRTSRSSRLKRQFPCKIDLSCRRARWSRTFVLASVMPRMSAVSCSENPCWSKSQITVR